MQVNNSQNINVIVSQVQMPQAERPSGPPPGSMLPPEMHGMSSEEAYAKLEAIAEEQGVTVDELIEQHLSAMESQREMGGMAGMPPPPQDELSDYFAQYGNDETVQNFMDDVMTMSQSDEFDAQVLAVNAPDSLKTYAEEQGIDLAAFFMEKQEQMESRGTPPPMQSNQSQTYSSVSQMSTEQDSNLTSLILKAMNVHEQV